MNCAKTNYTKGLESLMDNSISQKTENKKRYLPHDLKTKEKVLKILKFIWRISCLQQCHNKKAAYKYIYISDEDGWAQS